MIGWASVANALEAEDRRAVIRALVGALRRASKEQGGRGVPRNGAGSCLSCFPYSDQYLPILCPRCEGKVCASCAQCDDCGDVWA